MGANAIRNHSASTIVDRSTFVIEVAA